LRGRYADGPASWSKHPRAGPDGRTNPPRHRRLSTDSPSRPQLKRAPPGRRTIVSSTRDRGRGGPLSPSGQVAEVDVTSGGLPRGVVTVCSVVGLRPLGVIQRRVLILCRCSLSKLYRQAAGKSLQQLSTQNLCGVFCHAGPSPAGQSTVPAVLCRPPVKTIYTEHSGQTRGHDMCPAYGMDRVDHAAA
jgi:hypothetical protein